MITQDEFIKKHNLKESDYYQENEWLYILNLKKNEFNKSVIKELPSKIEFTKNCDCDITIEEIEKISSDVIFNNKGEVKIYYTKEISENVVFNNNGNVEIDYVKEISKNVIFNNNGNVEIDYVEEFLENVVFNNNGNLNLGSCEDPCLPILKKIHSSVKFINKIDIYLNNIIDRIPEGISFNNKGSISARFIKEISENVIFENGEDLYLYELEKIHPSVKFINGRNINFYCNTNKNKILKGLIFSNKGSIFISRNVEYISDIIFNNDNNVRFGMINNGGNIKFGMKPIISQNVHFNNKGFVENKPFNVPKFLDPEKYLNKMIKQIYK